MFDTTKDLRKQSQRQKKDNDILDLTGNLSQPRYVCEDCDIELLLYPQGKIDNPFQAGPHYICRQCHIVIDTSLTKPPGMDEIKPIDLNPPTFTMVQEDKGDSLFPKIDNYDPEPDEDKWIKNMGATLISKRIDVRSDF